MDEQRRILRICLRVLYYSGLHPFYKIRKAQIIFCGMSYIITLALVFPQFLYEEIGFHLISGTFESVFTITHISSKLIILCLNKDRLKWLFEQSKQFVYPPNMGLEFEKELSTTLKFIRLSVTMFVVFVSLTVPIFMARPYFGQDLAIVCYIPDFIPRMCFIPYNDLVIASIALPIAGFDTTIYAFLGLLTIQFQIFNQIFLNLNLKTIGDGNEEDEEKALEQMRILIRYHNFLYDFFTELNNVAGYIFLMNLTIAPIALCFELYFISKSDNFVEMAKCFMYLTGISVEMFWYYCLPATLLTQESENSINAMYNCGWERFRFISIRKYLIIMMQRAQKGVILSAGNMFTIGLETCTQVFKLAFSFYTSLKIIGDESN